MSGSVESLWNLYGINEGLRVPVFLLYALAVDVQYAQVPLLVFSGVSGNHLSFG